MQCPHCQSDDVRRSRRKFWERFVLPVVSAQVYRCRDCKYRYWINVAWSRIALSGAAALVVVGVVVTMVLVRIANNAPPPVVRKLPPAARRRGQAIPKGLPPLSSVPRPADMGVPVIDIPALTETPPSPPAETPH